MDGNFVTTIVGIIITVIFGIPAYIVLNRKKSFTYAITDTPIISINEKIDDVAVTYKGKSVENLRIVMVTLWNSGNLPIREEDFSVPVSFCPEQTARGNSLVVAQIIEAPEASGAELYPYKVGHHSYRTALKKMLFNPGDSVTVKIIIADYGGENLEINVKGRIVGVKIKELNPNNFQQLSILEASKNALWAGVFAALIFGVFSLFEIIELWQCVVFTLVTIVVIFLTSRDPRFTISNLLFKELRNG